MGDFSVDLHELDDVVADLAACDRELEQLVDDLERQLTVLASTWTGQAASAAADARHRWEVGMSELREHLLSLRSAARLAHDHYLAAASTNAEMWRELS